MKISGIKFPLQFYAGRVATSDDEQHIKESIIQILATGKMEYLLKPDFGSNLNRRVFDPINVAVLVKIDIRDAIQKYEQRVKLTDVSANLSSSDVGIVGISIGFITRGKLESYKVNFSLGG